MRYCHVSLLGSWFELGPSQCQSYGGVGLAFAKAFLRLRCCQCKCTPVFCKIVSGMQFKPALFNRLESTSKFELQHWPGDLPGPPFSLRHMQKLGSAHLHDFKNSEALEVDVQALTEIQILCVLSILICHAYLSCPIVLTTALGRSSQSHACTTATHLRQATATQLFPSKFALSYFLLAEQYICYGCSTS